MKEPSNRVFWLVLILLLNLQFAAGLWHIQDPFVEGRFHYNWNPPYWLMRAEAINHVGLSHTYFGLADYQSHPQLIAPVLSTWTSVAGYGEASIRLLALLLTLLSTTLLAVAFKSWLGIRKALAFVVFFATLPLVYVYGRMIDQEPLVLFFLALFIWAMSRIDKNQKYGYLIAALGAIGMVLSDWSGYVFVAVLGVVALLLWRKGDEKQRVYRFWAVSGAGAALGLLLFFVQVKLQSSAETGTTSVGGLVELWKYRAGLTGSFSWGTWFSQQYYFLTQNYSVPLFLGALCMLFLAAARKVFPKDDAVWKVSVLALSIAGAQLLYMLIVPQASSVHIYFQYYFSIPVALGMVLFVEWLAHTQTLRRPWEAFLVISTVICILGAFNAYYHFKILLTYPSGVDVTDIALIKSFKDVSNETAVIAVEVSSSGDSWFAQPNIEYYAKRPIKSYLLSQGFPFAEYILTPRGYEEEFRAQLNTKHPFGKEITASLGTCSSHWCVLYMTKK